MTAALTREETTRFLKLDRADYCQGWEAGYRAGYQAGHDVGYGRAHVELDEDWSEAAGNIVWLCASRRINEPPLKWNAGQLAELRDRPTGEAWEAWQERHGEYRGGRVPWRRLEVVR